MNSVPSSAPARAVSACGARCAETRPLCLSVKARSGRASATAPEHLVAVAELGRFGAQELAPRRGVEIQVLHRDGGARRARRGPSLVRSAALRGNRPGARFAAGARHELHARHRGDRGERLAAKAHRRHGLQVLERWRSCSWRGAPAPAPDPRARCPRRRRPPARASRRPRRGVTWISAAPASRLFSSSSFSTEAGRSTTSPAAIWLTSSSGSARMAPMRRVYRIGRWSFSPRCGIS